MKMPSPLPWKRYGAYCFSIANGILDNAQDSEECVNDTWLRAWNAIPPTRPAVLKVFFAKITRHLSFDRYKARKSLKRGGGNVWLVLDELQRIFNDGTSLLYDANNNVVFLAQIT